MPRILVLNPNTNATTTAMMVQLVRAQLPADWVVEGCTAEQGAAMITQSDELATASTQVLPCWQRARASHWDGCILACFADPAIDALRDATGLPTIGIGEAAMLAASQQHARFGIATTTRGLDSAMHAMAQRLQVAHQYTGARYTQGEPHQLVSQPDALAHSLQHAVQECVHSDGAQCVVIGGGPLGQAAQTLAAESSVPLIAPLTAAAQWMQRALAPTPAALAASPSAAPCPLS